jgi:hypothetical protein
MAQPLSDSKLTELKEVCAETGTDLPHLVAEVRRWKEIAGRLGLSLDNMLDVISRLDEMPRDPTSADWRDVEKVAAEESLSELRFAQQAPGYERPFAPDRNPTAEQPPRHSRNEDA